MGTSDNNNSDIKEYTIVCGSLSPHGQPIHKTVNDLIKNGWRPLGGIVVSSSGSTYDLLYQAMVR